MSARLGGTLGLRAAIQPQMQAVGTATISLRCFSSSSVCSGRLDPELRKKGLRTLGRQDMKRFLDTLEAKWEERQAKGGNSSTGFYLGPHVDQPFPLNPQFRSQPVLSEPTREWIWRRVSLDREPLKLVSADLGIDVRRVAAVVRLKEVEKRWLQEGKKLATPYREAIMSMLPQTRYYIPGPRDGPVEHQPHEPINELHTHGHTLQQIFWPVAESRTFTRKDAAKAFSPIMTTPESRSMHRELIVAERKALREPQERKELMNQWKMNLDLDEHERRKLAQEKVAEEQARTIKAASDRFEFRFHDFNAENVGKDGRLRNAVGLKYGVPSYDRKRGQIKIPTSVP